MNNLQVREIIQTDLTSIVIVMDVVLLFKKRLKKKNLLHLKNHNNLINRRFCRLSTLGYKKSNKNWKQLSHITTNVL